MKKMCIVLCLTFGLGVSAAAQQVFLDIPSIPGESTNAEHANEIDILSWSQSVANVDNMPVVLPLVFTHEVDKASPKLVEAALAGTDLGTAVLSAVVTGAQQTDFLVIKLNNTKVVAVKNGASNGQFPVETVTLTCSSFTLSYWEIDMTGGQGNLTETTGSCGN